MSDLVWVNKPMMTVKEVAQAFNCEERTIQLKVKEFFPDIVKNGKTTYLDESQVTKIKLDLQGNKHLESVFELPKTNLEKLLLIRQAEQIRDEMIAELQAQVLLQAPKCEAYDVLIKTDTDMSITQAAKHFGKHPRLQVIPFLRLHKYLTEKNLPSQSALDLDIMSLKQVVCDNKTRSQSIVKTCQLDNFRKHVIAKIKE